MIHFRSITLSRGGRNLLTEASAAVSPGENLALIGPNGSGKTTLLRALIGEVLPDSGAIEMPAMDVNLLEQTPVSSPMKAWQYVLAADQSLTDASQALEQAQADDDGMAIAQALDQWQMAGGDSAQARCQEMLSGLGFSQAQTEAPVDTLSGGWRMRLNLARVLFRPGDLLLLDEPTNHLDLDAVLWLERHLNRSPATVLVVSHDRDFLDAVVAGTLSIEHNKLVRYKGGYSACEEQRAQRLADTQRAADQSKAEAARLQKFIDRFRAQANKARQVQSRIKAMQRLAVATPLTATRRMNMRLDDVGRMPDPVVRTEDLSAGYGDTQILGGINIKIERAARIGILGRNGHGKTTLVRTLIGELDPLAGHCQRSPQVRVGYFAQDAVEHLRDDESALDHLRREAGKDLPQPPPDGELRRWLGRFSFSDEDALRPVGPMSGGEKSRLVLALILWIRPQVLVLDEPTNHLDGHTRDELTNALLDFDGVLLVVSHDRYLLRASVDRFWLVSGGLVTIFEGDLDDYGRLLRQEEKRPADKADAQPDDANVAAPSRQDRKAKKQADAARRAELAGARRPLQRELSKVEKSMAHNETALKALAAQLADQNFYEDADKASEAIAQHKELDRKQQQLEARWLELSESLEALSAGG